MGDAKICPRCGKENKQESIRCYNCGIDLNNTANENVARGNIDYGTNRVTQGNYNYGTVPEFSNYNNVNVKCIKCGFSFSAGNKNCPQCGFPVGMFPKEKTRPKLTVIHIIGIIFAVFIIGLFLFGERTDNTSDESYSTTENVADVATASIEVTEESAGENAKIINSDMITTDTKNLKIDQVVNCDGLYVSLSYVKRTDVFTTAFYDTQEELGNGNELIYLFFEVYNGSSEIKKSSSEYVKCYADSNQVFAHDSSFFSAQDGVKDDYSYDVDIDTSAIILSNFEVPTGWQELDIYYNDINWHITQGEADTEPFANDNVTLTENRHDDTLDGTVLYGSGYELRYDGFTFATEQYSSSEYIVFLFHATNTSNEQLDFSLIGYNMRCYHNNIHIGTADYGFGDNVKGYTNIYDVDGIEAGMTTDVYVAFEVNSSDKSGYYSMTYDDAYITNDVKGYIYSHVD